ncbi:MAG TPA: helix-turn-helix transcriptional regulator [Thermoanaerobaculia bacterium]|nr:helix-turn-helix transcriptional regulator [Thermoanaerobaculia bacterium]
MKEATPAGLLLGQRVRELRTKRQLTQQALAESAGIPQTHVSAIELGLMQPNLGTLLRLALALGCKVSTLVSVFDKEDLAKLVMK